MKQIFLFYLIAREDGSIGSMGNAIIEADHTIKSKEDLIEFQALIEKENNIKNVFITSFQTIG